MKSKRPWKKKAGIRRIERNDGTVTFMPWRYTGHGSTLDIHQYNEQPTLVEAEKVLNAWWAEVVAVEKAAWPKNIKSIKRA